ncbi:Transcription activator, effector binding (plasmid) [Legionella adelaidensis]|uniref:Bacterial transcription activator n=1 Tax=Legionella adelaidensis TaxID=45056 RepID=A0A0W0R5I2_9GAMM|nr:GyrI-like domain-containing protein [Legionella adelaidensis]KTC66281.1 Bacterial transcription activator [Legionella adelaidensis]VEH84877.1 Transcription activator, effector binding [Legionella adelaidensis]
MSLAPPSFKYVESFTVTGFSARTKNSDEFMEKTAKIPALWQQLYSSNLAANTSLFGVYSDYQSDANGLYTITVGTQESNLHSYPSSIKIHTGNYLVFHGKGPMPLAVIETWKHIWNYFETNHQNKRNFISDFELYDGVDEVSIYIGIN